MDGTAGLDHRTSSILAPVEEGVSPATQPAAACARCGSAYRVQWYARARAYRCARHTPFLAPEPFTAFQLGWLLLGATTYSGGLFALLIVYDDPKRRWVDALFLLLPWIAILSVLGILRLVNGPSSNERTARAAGAAKAANIFLWAFLAWLLAAIVWQEGWTGLARLPYEVLTRLMNNPSWQAIGFVLVVIVVAFVILSVTVSYWVYSLPIVAFVLLGADYPFAGLFVLILWLGCLIRRSASRDAIDSDRG